MVISTELGNYYNQVLTNLVSKMCNFKILLDIYIFQFIYIGAKAKVFTAKW